MKLREFSIEPGVGLDQIEIFSRNADELNELILNGPQVGDWRFRNRQNELRDQLMLGSAFELVVTYPDDLTHILNLWIIDDDFNATVPVTRERLDEIVAHSSKTSTKHIRLVARLYLERFDKLPCFQEFGPTLCAVLWELPEERRRSRLVQTYCDRRATLFTETGPEQLAKRASEESGDIYAIARTHYIPSRDGSRYFEVARPLFLMRRLHVIGVGDDDPSLVQLSAPTVRKVVLPDRTTVAQRAAMLLVDRTLQAGATISPAWLGTIVSLLGDPRRDRGSTEFKLGWGRLRDERYRNSVGGWLSAHEISIFLRLLHDAVNRGLMSPQVFEDRQRYLDGLQRSGLISSSLLLLSKEGEALVREANWDRYPPHFMRLAGNEECLLYLNVNEAHLIEGDGGFGIRVYRRLDEDKTFVPGINHHVMEELPAETRIDPCATSEPPWQLKVVDALGNLTVIVQGELVVSPTLWERFKPKNRKQAWRASQVITEDD